MYAQIMQTNPRLRSEKKCQNVEYRFRCHVQYMEKKTELLFFAYVDVNRFFLYGNVHTFSLSKLTVCDFEISQAA